MSAPLLQQLFEAISRWHARRMAIRTLSALNDRTLRDIGIIRSEIQTVVDDHLRPTCRSHERGKRVAIASDDGPPHRNIELETQQW